MAKSLTRPESDMDLILTQAVDTVASRYFQTKTSADGFGIMDRARALRLLLRSAMRITRRGHPAGYVAATSILPPTN
jgi:hypothetical protein